MDERVSTSEGGLCPIKSLLFLQHLEPYGLEISIISVFIVRPNVAGEKRACPAVPAELINAMKTVQNI
jgi:hypothetical protein